MVANELTCAREEILKSAQKADRNPQDIILVCVTKSASIDQVKEAITFGITDIGENRIDSALSKYKQLGDKAKTLRWHMIGHLQTNKVKKALEIFDIIHSVDSLRLAEEIDKRASLLGKRIDCLIEVNTSGESSKYGIKPGDLQEFLKQISSLSSFNVIGLMTMAPFVDDPETVRPFFKKLRQLKEELNSKQIPNIDLRELSMGMSQDYGLAIEEGATMVRVGTAIFGQ
ncbi:YggS family pyridoxal phosphate-dependent enzyme [Candidatus Omnitrophota bacterium]